jgi:hypothetical protein
MLLVEGITIIMVIMVVMLGVDLEVVEGLILEAIRVEVAEEEDIVEDTVVMVVVLIFEVIPKRQEDASKRDFYAFCVPVLVCFSSLLII